MNAFCLVKRVYRLMPYLLCCVPWVVQAAWDLGRDGVTLRVTAEPERVDPGRDFFVTIQAETPKGVSLALPDLRGRFRGFQVAEDFTEEPLTDASGVTTYVSRWRLVPQPVSEEGKYSLRPFAVMLSSGTSFYTQPVVFENPAAREPVTGEMEVNPTKDLPPFSWALAGWIALALVVLAAILWGLFFLIRKVREMVRVHKMSPVERAMHELTKLLARGLPGRGQYKDFYVELTLVVRRYVQRQYGVKAPNMTTQEFLAELAHRTGRLAQIGEADALGAFLESADLVKFAGVSATPTMADEATERARTYIEKDGRRVLRDEAEVTK